MREIEGHLFSDIAGKPYVSQCVKCGIVVDWQAIRRQGVSIPKCSYHYPEQQEMRHTLCGFES